jgi:hypothetical protein
MSQPFFSSRKWIKVWINEWREGTLRWQATDSQRAFWIDLLALAGRSRYPGIVCAGMEGDKVVGYPASFLAPNSEITAANIEDTLKLFETQGMITFTTSKSVNGATLYAITITNWKKYQSNYEANRKYQKDYRQKKKKAQARPQASSQTVERLDARNPLESEVEKEKEGEKSSSSIVHGSRKPARSRPMMTTDDLKKIVLGKSDDQGGVIANAIDIIVERAVASGIQIHSPKYIEQALQRFDFAHGQDHEELVKRLHTL